MSVRARVPTSNCGTARAQLPSRNASRANRELLHCGSNIHRADYGSCDARNGRYRAATRPLREGAEAPSPFREWDEADRTAKEPAELPARHVVDCNSGGLRTIARLAGFRR